MKNSEEKWVNWLADAEMLPHKLLNARIMRFGYRSEWFGPENVETKKTLVSDVVELLLRELKHYREVSQLECIGDAASTNKLAQGSKSTTTFHYS